MEGTMANIENGKIIDKNVELKTYPSIEHGNINNVTSIVLHRTDSSSAKSTLSTLNAYTNGKKFGAHFLIDKNGKIYQTANMTKICWHVGILLPRCRIENNCDPNELKTITSLTHEKGFSFSRRAKNLSRHEVCKKYPLRYPSNNDSIGIEVVGKFWPGQQFFDKPTIQQLKSLNWLAGIIVKKYKLNIKNDVYAHGEIARKEVSEGTQLLQYLFYGVVQ